MIAPRPLTFTSQRLTLHATEWGDPAAPPLVLIHGGRDHGRSWDAVAKALAAEWRVIAPDLRGHGDSAWTADGNYHPEAMAGDLAALIETFGDAPLTLVGHSLGGNIALRYGAAFPERVRRLIAIEGLGPSPKLMRERDALGPGGQLRGWIEARARIAGRELRRYATVAEATARMRAANARLTEAMAAHLTEHGVRREADGAFVWKFDPALPASVRLPDLSEVAYQTLWRAVACPTLLIYGRDSWASDPREDGRAAHLPNAKIAMIEGAGHWVHHDQPEAFLAALRSFL